MKEEDLIKYRNKLLHYYQNENYCIFNTFNGQIQSEAIGVNNIYNKVNTIIAVGKFETATEKFTKTLVLQGIDFDTIDITINNNVFISQYINNKIENIKNVKERVQAKKQITPKDLLPQITISSISFTAKKDGNTVYKSANPTDLGYINYEEFTSMVENLGYNISPKTFDKLAIKAIQFPINSGKSRITVDFSNKTKSL